MTRALPCALAAVAAALLALPDARATTSLGGGPAPAFVFLEGEPADRCGAWARDFAAREAERAKDLQLPESEVAQWARERAEKARMLCGRFSLNDPGRWPAGRAVVDADLGLPPGFLGRLGFTASDLDTWKRAAASGAEAVYPRTARREAFLKDRPKSGCSAESGAVHVDGKWVWCRTARFDSLNYDPFEQLRRMAVVALVIGAGVIVLVGFAVLFILGRRAAQETKPRR